MPYANQYNAAIAQRVRGYSQQNIDRENAINDFTTSYDIPSQLEASVLKEPRVHGGSGFAAATVADLGFEPTLGAISGEGKTKRVKKKVLEVGEGLAAAGMSAGGVSGGALLSLRDWGAMHGQPADSVRANVTVTSRPEAAAVGGSRCVGYGISGGARGKRHEIVKEVMRKHGLSLPAASKYVKEHNLY